MNRQKREEEMVPGSMLRQAMEHSHMSTADLASKTGFSAVHINGVLDGTRHISLPFAKALEKALEVPELFWAGLQARYEEYMLSEGSASAPLLQGERVCLHTGAGMPASLRQYAQMKVSGRVVRSDDEEVIVDFSDLTSGRQLGTVSLSRDAARQYLQTAEGPL